MSAWRALLDVLLGRSVVVVGAPSSRRKSVFGSTPAGRLPADPIGEVAGLGEQPVAGEVPVAAVTRILARQALRRRPRGERGSVTVYVVAMMVSLFTVIGLAVDGTQAAQAVSHANAIAAQAARTGGQAIDQAAAVQGQDVVDPAAAVAAAQSYLAAAGVDGQVQIVGNQVVVDVTISTQTTFLALIGINEFTLDGHATADLARS